MCKCRGSVASCAGESNFPCILNWPWSLALVYLWKEARGTRTPLFVFAATSSFVLGDPGELAMATPCLVNLDPGEADQGNRRRCGGIIFRSGVENSDNSENGVVS